MAGNSEARNARRILAVATKRVREPGVTRRGENVANVIGKRMVNSKLKYVFGTDVGFSALSPRHAYHECGCQLKVVCRRVYGQFGIAKFPMHIIISENK